MCRDRTAVCVSVPAADPGPAHWLRACTGGAWRTAGRQCYSRDQSPWQHGLWRRQGIWTDMAVITDRAVPQLELVPFPDLQPSSWHQQCWHKKGISLVLFLQAAPDDPMTTSVFALVCLCVHHSLLRMCNYVIVMVTVALFPDQASCLIMRGLSRSRETVNDTWYDK